MSTLYIPKAIYEAVRMHGEETYPHECCGVLLGHSTPEGWRVASAVRAGNTRTDSAHNRYHIAPVELVKIQREASRAGPGHRRLLSLPSRPPGAMVAHRFRRGPLDRLQLRHHRGRAGKSARHQFLSPRRHDRGGQALRERGYCHHGRAGSLSQFAASRASLPDGRRSDSFNS